MAMSRHKKLFFTLSTLALITINTIVITGCGFKISTTKSFPPQLSQIYYQSDNPYGQLSIALKKRLKSCGMVLLPTPEKTAPIIHTTSNYSYSSSNMLSSTQGRVYNLNYTASIKITDFYNKPLLDTQNVSVTRGVLLQPNEIFETTPQIEIAKKEMVQELSSKLLNILAAHKTAEVLNINL